MSPVSWQECNDMKLVEDEDDMDAIWRRVSQLGEDVYLVFQFLLDLVESTIIKILATTSSFWPNSNDHSKIPT